MTAAPHAVRRARPLSPRPDPPPTAVFDRVLCAVDGSWGSLDTAVQSSRLLAYGGALELVSCVDAPRRAPEPDHVALARLSASEAWLALDGARELVGPATTRVAYGPPARALLEAAVTSSSTLVMAGCEGRGRRTGTLLGSVPAALLRHAPCSVLVGRTARDPASFPREIVVGADGSPDSLLAVAAAAELAERLRAHLRIVVALGGSDPDVDAVRAVAGRVELDRRDPLSALLDAARHADLVLLGSRGLGSRRPIGRVSELVAHAANASVLVVRDVAAARVTAGATERPRQL